MIWLIDFIMTLIFLCLYFAHPGNEITYNKAHRVLFRQSKSTQLDTATCQNSLWNTGRFDHPAHLYRIT